MFDMLQEAEDSLMKVKDRLRMTESVVVHLAKRVDRLEAQTTPAPTAECESDKEMTEDSSVKEQLNSIRNVFGLPPV